MRRFDAKKILQSTIFMGNVKINITKPNSVSNKSVRPSYKAWLSKMNLFVRSVRTQGRRSNRANRR